MCCFCAFCPLCVCLHACRAAADVGLRAIEAATPVPVRYTVTLCVPTGAKK